MDTETVFTYKKVDFASAEVRSYANSVRQEVKAKRRSAEISQDRLKERAKL